MAPKLLRLICVFLQILTISNAFQITSLWRKNQHKAKGALAVKCESHECKFKQQACLNDCQRGLAKGLGFCASFGGTYAPFIEKYGEDYARDNDGYLENLISRSKSKIFRIFVIFLTFSVASLEGVFLAIANYCGDEKQSFCFQCGSGVDFKEILNVQNVTLEDLKESENLVQDLQDQLAILTRNVTENLRIPEQALVKMLMYEEVLHQTDQILYW